METQVAKTTTNLPASKSMMGSQTLSDMGITSQDIVAQKLFLTQPQSPQVADGKAKPGDIYNLDTGEIVGSVDKPVDIVPLKREKVWVVKDVGVTPPRTIRIEDFKADGPKLPFEDIETDENGKQVKIRRDQSHMFTVLLAKEAEAGTSYPCRILFTRTSAQAGVNLASLMARRAASGQSPLHYSVSLMVTKEKNENMLWFQFRTGFGTKLSELGCREAEKWFEVARAKKIVDGGTATDEGNF